jgi:chloramphenicol-sensitive protein RarD
MFYAIAAYVSWGLFPLYFRLLKDIPPFDIVLHRLLWSCLFLLLVLAARRRWAWLGRALRQPLILRNFLCSALLISANWLLYIWAVNNDRVVDASLGYFITPLLNVLLGCVLFKERLRPLQWMATAIAAAGVVWLTWSNGALPWISLMLAASFGLYGVMRKTAQLGPLEGLSLETLLVFPIVAAISIYTAAHGTNSYLNAPASAQWLLAASGPITALPLLLFAAGLRRIPLSLVGLLQYIAPTLQFCIAIWIFDEPFSGTQMTAFLIIWAALAVYSLESLRRGWANRGTC